jgi:hypothetical protein
MWCCNRVCGNQRVNRMTDSAVLDTVLGLIVLFYALAVLCGGVVEMIANWVKKRAKYLLRGIRDLLDDVPAKELAVAEKRGWMQKHRRNCLSQQHGRTSAIRRDAPRTHPDAAVRSNDCGANERRLDHAAAGAANAPG